MTTNVAQNFWRLESPDYDHKQVSWDDGMDWESIVCPINQGHQRAGKRITDLHIILNPQKITDFMWTPVFSYCLISDAVFKLFKKEGLSGFEVKPVKSRVEGSNNTPPVFWELVLTGWGGLATHKSGIQLDRSNSCPVCGNLRYTGLCSPPDLIDLNAWDGSDFFMVWPMPRYIFTTERVIKIIRDSQISGFVATPVLNLKETNGFSPGRLHYHMPDDRARRLGIPLGIY